MSLEPNLGPLKVCALLALLVACAGEAGPPVVRVRLFDLMDRARFEGVEAPRAGESEAQAVAAWDFDGSSPPVLWRATTDSRGMRYREGGGELAGVEPSGGVRGGFLRLGPGTEADDSLVSVVTPIAALARVRVSGRVRLEENPSAQEASTREVLRVVEHAGEVTHPGRVSRWGRRYSITHRVSRRIDPSDWDHFDVSFLTAHTTGSLELQLLHRTGGSGAAVTRFDEVEIEQTPLSDAEAYAGLRESHRPRDGQADATPWRLRVSLRAADGNQQEVRDAVLLPPPASLSFPLTVPEKSTRPLLRFHYAMAPEAFAAAGDGAAIEVDFTGEDGERTAVGTLAFDPKNDHEQRSWTEARLDLVAVAGRTGRLRFTSTDADGEPDPLDAVLIATPRIEPAELTPSRPNVLLIGVDTLRADRMGVFGYARDNTPHLSALGAVGVSFPKTRSQAPWTLPSFSSIMTSLYPSTHGAGRGGHDEWTPIDPTTLALAEVLARAGYQTHGIVANGLISPQYGLDQGFESYCSEWAMESARRDAEQVAEFVDVHRTTPWFLFWHIMDPHLPYSTEDGWRERFCEPGYEGRFASKRRAYVPFDVLDPRPGRRWFTHEGPPPEPELTEADRRFVNDYYVAEIAEMDAAVGRVLDAVRASGAWERTIVAFVADHGEGLGDHGHYHHGYTLFDDQVHIPMLLRIPGRDEGRVVGRAVASIDLAPMILGGLGLPVPPAFRGVDRLTDDAPAGGAYFIEYPTYDSSAEKAWVEGDFKYLHDPVFHTEALYDLGADPGEQQNVLAEHPDLAARARDELDAFRWEQLQKGRFHLRVHGRAGQRLSLAVTTDDLFDANFACRPKCPETDFALDLGRRKLTLDTTLETDRLELVFWCRGTILGLDLRLDGEALPGGVALGPEGLSRPLPLELDRGGIPQAASGEVSWPDVAGAALWLECGVGEVPGVVLSPEEIEVLEELGYTR
ncbi:MAG: sulfatase [Planctomycetota bacterium]|jgi:arylsulfatase A-like enzyme|nr:sulfatase [Planctomycetota bacterium]